MNSCALLGVALALIGCDDGEFAGAADDESTPAEASPDEAAPNEPALGDAGPEVAAAYEHLRRYGYFPSPELAERYPGWVPVVDAEPDDPQVLDERIAEALTRYQEAHGLPATGALDAATQALMHQPRCGFPDHYVPQSAARLLGSGGGGEGPIVPAAGDALADPIDPSEFGFLGPEWPFLELRYGFTGNTLDVGVDFQRQAVIAAMNTWSAHAPIMWAERANPDVRIGFLGHAHGDTNFGPQDYAHGLPPICYTAFLCAESSGDLHFNDPSFAWGTGNGFSVQDIQTHALHELGHALGLSHSNNSNAVMYPTLPSGVVRRTLAQDDIEGIQALYYEFRDPWSYDGDWYLALYPKLVEAFGYDLNTASIHWLKFGRSEFRRGTPTFDVGYYLKNNPDIALEVGGAGNWAGGFWHWREKGLKAGRRGSHAFDVKYYLNRYPP